MTIAELLSGVDRPSRYSCWWWEGAVNAQGYGSIGQRGLAHRIAYEHLVGPIPDGWHVHHLCHNKLCLNPLHLEALTASEHSRRHGLGGNAARNRAATTCRRGHAFDFTRADGGRGCSTCKRERGREDARRRRSTVRARGMTEAERRTKNEAKRRWRAQRRAEGLPVS